MKFNKINVDAFGPFTDLKLDFEGGQNLHVFYGLNEAGKSSLLRAIRALLFGINPQTPDAFLHDYNTLKIGAEISKQNGDRLSFSRLKKAKDPLRDATGKPISESLLQNFLGHESLDTFTAFYGLDHEELRRGGQEMLAGKGDLARALFETGGASGLSRVSREYKEIAEQLFTPRAQRPLNQALRAVEESKRAVRQFLLRSADWQQLQSERERLSIELAGFRSRSQELKVERDRLKRIRDNKQDLSERDSLVTQLMELGAIPNLPADFTEQRIRYNSELEAANDAIENNASTLKKLSLQLGAIPAEFPIVSSDSSIAALVRRLDSYKNSLKDLHKRAESSREEYHNALAIWRQLFPELDVEHIEEFRLSQKDSSKLNALLTDRKVRVAKQGKDEERLEDAKNSLKQARAALASAVRPTDVSAFRAIAESVKTEGPLEDLVRKAAAINEQAARALHSALHALPFWTVTAIELRALHVPLNETIDSYVQVQEKQRQDANEIDKELQKAAVECRRTLEEIDSLAAGKPLPTVEQLAVERDIRNRGWELIQRSAFEHTLTVEEATRQYEPPATLAVAFKTHLQKADQIADQLIEGSQRVVRNEELHRSLARIEERQLQLGIEKQSLDQEIADTASEWGAQWPGLPFAVLSSREMQGWLRKRETVLSALVKAEEAAAGLSQAQQALTNAISRVSSALQACGLEGAREAETLGSLLLRSQSFIDSQDDLARELRELEKTIREAEVDIPRLEATVEGHASQEVAWDQEWQMATSHIPKDYRSPGIVEPMLLHFAELFSAWDRHLGLDRRVASIQNDIDSFRQDVDALCAVLAPEIREDAPDSIVEALSARLDHAKSQQNERKELSTRIEEIEADQDLQQQKKRRASGEIRRLCSLANVDAVTELPLCEKRCEEANALRLRIEALEAALARRNGISIQAVIQEAQSDTIDQLRANIQEVESNLDEIDERRDTSIKDLHEADRSLKEKENSDAFSAAVQSSQNAITTSMELAECYVVQRLAAAVLDKAMDSYREKNQGQVVERAGTIFASLTDGQFGGLLADSDENGDNKLFALRPDKKKRLEIEALSDGTSDQLFLALRLASIEQRATNSEPLPCVFDDILINYDEIRTSAALKVLADIATKTQVLLFTHHHRTVELAEQECCGKFSLHHLGSKATTQHT
jgi:uncharacterized protein YhaN